MFGFEMTRRKLLWLLAALSIAAASVLFWFVLKNPKDRPTNTMKNSHGPVWGYRCEAETCIKVLISPEHPAANLSALSVCKQLCGNHGNLWPKPTNIMLIGKELDSIDVKSISASKSGTNPAINKVLNGAFNLFRSKQQSKAKVLSITDGSTQLRLEVHLNISYPGNTALELGTDESYHLDIDPVTKSKIRATIFSNNFFGARHGLETLDQLIVIDDLHNEIRIPNRVNITDRPSYLHRGILIDTSRSFIKIEALKRTIDAMAASKLNTLHWHITDSQSFPFESKSFPDLSRLGAYSDQHVYSERTIKELVEFARERGVRIVPELDAPAHVGEGWQFAPGTVLCFKAKPWREFCLEPPCGQLDPTNNQVYDILGGVYADMLRAFNTTLFHMGGDEVNFNCWNSSETIQEWFKARNLSSGSDDSFHDLWNSFQTRALEKLYAANAGSKITAFIWTNSLVNSTKAVEYLDPEKYIIQVWTKGNDTLIKRLADKNYRMILSNYDALYLDCGYGSWIGTSRANNWCSPYKSWQRIYDNNPRTLMKNLGVPDESLSLALGAEVAMWTEQTGTESVDSKIWPRAAALAERLWSDPVESNSEAAQTRLLEHRERLVKLGVFADSIQPQWCLYNEGHCI